MIKYIFTIAVIITTNIITALLVANCYKDTYEAKLKVYKHFNDEYRKAFIRCVQRLRKYEDKEIDYPNTRK